MLSGNSRGRKPRLLFLRSPRPELPLFVQRHLREHVACLEQHFDVVLVAGDCDYEAACETHRPDIAMFESGIYGGPRRISRTSKCPEIPKVGFCNSDAYCVSRSAFLSDMERWGVETFFTLSVAMAEYTPEIADRLFVWPNFVDSTLYRDYGLGKHIPVLFTGSQASHYPWRRQVKEALAPHYQSVTTPHGGWADARATGDMVEGRAYAELLNTAWVVPTCGTIAREVVRKHFEIPAARACLVAERTAGLEAAGFVDMENAVFAEPDDVVEKLRFLFANPEELRRITDAGFDLVHSHHTMAQRDQLLQWLTLHESARPGERIVQSGPFQALRLVPASDKAVNSHVVSRGLDRRPLCDGERLLTLGRYAEARGMFVRCLAYHFMPEPLLGLARCELYLGRAAAAIELLAEPIDRTFWGHFAVDPDPVEWAFLIRALLCLGDVRGAARLGEQFSHLAHAELVRIRHVTSALAGRKAEPSIHDDDSWRARPSVHRLPEVGDAEWTDDLCTMLRACGQDRFADAVIDRQSDPVPGRRPIWRRLGTRSYRRGSATA